jgi:hypothetical protein
VYWLAYSLWKARFWHQALVGSVIPFLRIDELHQIYTTQQNIPVSIIPKLPNKKLAIRLINDVKINRNAISTPLLNFLKKELNFLEPEF